MIGQIDRVAQLDYLNSKNANNSVPNVAAVLSGKGGTGKTFFAANAGYLYSQKHGKVLLIELNHNLSNLSAFFNTNVKKTIGSFFESAVPFSEVITEVSPNLHIIFGDSGKLNNPEITEQDIQRIFQNFTRLNKEYDLILLDTGSGADGATLFAASQSSSIILVSTPEPTAIMDAYVITKLLYHNHNIKSISVLFNNCLSEKEGTTSFENLSRAVQHFLKTQINHIASIPQSSTVRSSIMSQQLFAEFYPNHKVTLIISEALNQINKNLQLFNINHSLR